MPSNALTRRGLLATGVSTAAALALSRFLTSPEVRAADSADVRTFYDPRFPRSRDLADALPGAPPLYAVSGDPSHLLAHIPGGRPRTRDLRLQGVTTETVPFCLEQLARRHHEVRFESRRLDRDLFVWTLTIRAPAAVV